MVSLKKLLERSGQPVTDIELTSGNYDTSGVLIEGQVPTLTTNFCEIGAYDNVCYFTIILVPESFSKDLLEQIKGYKDMHIYGFENFLEDFYPKDNFSYDNFAKDINKDNYVQVQFNFDRTGSTAQKLMKQHQTLKAIFNKNKAIVINQMKHKFK